MFLISNRYSPDRNGPIAMLGGAPNHHDPTDVRTYSVSSGPGGAWMLTFEFALPEDALVSIKSSGRCGNRVEHLYPIYSAATRCLKERLDQRVSRPLYMFPKCNSNPEHALLRGAELERTRGVTAIVFSCPVERRHLVRQGYMKPYKGTERRRRD